MSELTDAIKAGDALRVMSLLDADPEAITRADHGVSPLMLAIYHGKADVARGIADRHPALSFPEVCALGDLARAKDLLAQDRSRLEERSTDGFPPLGLAIFFRHSELAQWLIAEGADVNAAAENAQRVAPLHAAAAVCDQATAEMLLARGADPHAKQQMEYTPLHGAASRGDVAFGRLLLTHGASLDAKAADGMTPADVAAKYGHPDWFAAVSE
jgi:ankyrin repeat protein